MLKKLSELNSSRCCVQNCTSPQIFFFLWTVADDDALLDAWRFRDVHCRRNSSQVGGRNPLELIQFIIFVLTTTFSMWPHAMHLNVRMSKPGGPDIMTENIICSSHFVQGGRSTAARLGSSEISVLGMMLPFVLRRERDTFQSPIC
jgi:hypothetical protein